MDVFRHCLLRNGQLVAIAFHGLGASNGLLLPVEMPIVVRVAIAVETVFSALVACPAFDAIASLTNQAITAIGAFTT